MAGAEAEDYLARMTTAGRSVPEDLKEAKLRYNVNGILLGGLTLDGKGGPKYEPSMRQLPHLGARVGIPSEDALRLICSLGVEAGEKPAILGRLAFGNHVFDGDGQANLPVPFVFRRMGGPRNHVFS